MSYLLAIISAVCVLTGVAVWLTQAARELSQKRTELNFAYKQLATYNMRCARVRDGPEAQRTLEQVELSQEIYQHVAAEYNHCIAQPKNRLLALCLGYRPAPEVKLQ